MKNFVPLYLLWEESVTFVSATINIALIMKTVEVSSFLTDFTPCLL